MGTGETGRHFILCFSGKKPENSLKNPKKIGLQFVFFYGYIVLGYLKEG
jgi:hypothetical protein